jgi:CHAT domain-containing protein
MLAGRNGEFLIQKHAVFYAPSLAFLVWRSKHRQDHGAERQLLALANPAISSATATQARARIRGEALGALPEAEREVRELSSIYGRSHATLRIGAAATEKEFKRAAGRYRILHLATHGMYDDTDPMYSHLVLARSAGDDNDGLLEAREIVDLDLHADLAVLSACATGRAVARGGEGMIGLSWAFLGAGCPAAVVSMWSVESAATARLMVDFHRRLVRGDSPPEALRRAEVSLMTSRRYHHPYYWAPFVVVGAPWP